LHFAIIPKIPQWGLVEIERANLHCKKFNRNLLVKKAALKKTFLGENS
jgi:hypothetical protein